MKDTPERHLAVAQSLTEMAHERIKELETQLSAATEALEAVQNYFWGVDSPVLSEGEVQEMVETVLKTTRGK